MTKKTPIRGRPWLRLHPIAASIDRRVPVEWVAKRAIVSHRYRYCYFRIPKCANSTIVQTLATYDSSIRTRSDKISRRDLKWSSRNLFRAFAWSPSSLARRYFCFTVVRNPYTRLLSAYLDKIVDGVGDYRRVVDALGKNNIKEVSFPEFIEFLENGGLFANAHWTPQHALLPIGPERLSFVGRVETLDEDLRTLTGALLPHAKYVGTRSREDRRRDSQTHLPDYYRADLAERVARLYADDFRIFGYSTALPASADTP